MSNGAVYVRDSAAWTRYAVSPELGGACMALAEAGKAYAESISPSSTAEAREYFDERYGPRRDQRSYRDCFEVEEFVAVGFRSGPRAGARLINTAGHAAAVEFGNAATPRPHRVLGRTAAHLGGAP